MVEDDTFTYHVKQQSADQINKAAQSLITKERTQKLDLLIHLLSNLTQALVVCGPEGIGKTTLLKILQERNTEPWRYCLIQGNTTVSFETVQEQLVKAQLGKSLQYQGQYKQVILIIDNAGQLVPGLIAAIIQYAAANPILRVVFALTHDEWQVKRGSDRAIDDCHIIEIPSLSEKQCGDFLQYLSTLPYANLSFKAISDNMIAHIYRETHGVPGRIIAEVSGLPSGTKQGGKLKWILVLAVAIAVAIALGAQWLISPATAPSITPSPNPAITNGGNAASLPGAGGAAVQSSRNSDKELIAPVAAAQKADNIAVAPVQPESQIALALPPIQPVIQQQSAPAKASTPPAQVPYPPPVGNEENKAKNALEPQVAVNVNRNNQQPVIATAKPETVSAAVDKSLTGDALRSSVIAPVSTQASTHSMPLGAEQEKPKQSESSKPVNDVVSPLARNLEIKGQPEPVATVGMDQKPNGKQPTVAQQNAADRLWASREKLKQAELKKTINRMEPFTPNKLETIQIPEKPVEVVAIPEERTIEMAVPQQVEPEKPLAQSSADNLTLQLMVLSKQSSVEDTLRKYPALAPDIRVIRTIVKGKEKFVLEYGSYPDSTSANKAKESLPFEFHRALVRKIVR